MDDAAPLILTLALDATSFARLEALRRAHFPPGRNVLSAHLTLFHALPGAERAAVEDRLAALAAATPMPALRFAGLRSLGRGTAYSVESTALMALREELARDWRPWLTPQDAKGFRPHVTVQNKVTPEAARSLLAALQRDFTPWQGRGEALCLWHYRGGPWEAAARFGFGGTGAEAAPPPPPLSDG
ncbi:2'-5' RNA ligase family protein [Pseudoroseomonas cervicalis]|uniref:2'-5' RNA ligase family protein n=1 Tax=Teichococcus cervicalis TaxID=204525 RepID=UPI0027832E98|nr:2'-5' RNA ligase family protein [Pseudoroseomonas cervicalis]MDQ1081564.1 2'-5' RNA ligase [Pseudoroseomonas cervicalis]